MLKRYFIALSAIVLLYGNAGIAADETLFNLTSGGKDITVSMDGDTVTMSVKTIDDAVVVPETPEPLMNGAEPDDTEVVEIVEPVVMNEEVTPEPAVVVEPVVEVLPVVDETSVVKEAAISGSTMGMLFFVFILAIFLGVELIAKVPSQLHTPLMSGSNAISGITVVGALLVVRSGVANGNERMAVILGVLAVAFAMINVVGGYLVTDRMLGMFKHKD